MELVFSVIIPLFNKETTIVQTVNSVLNQDFTDFELLIIDDGSTDDSINQLSKISDTRLKIISKKNGGVSSARNLGIQSSQGRYCAFLDADDLWKTDYLSSMEKLINEFPNAGFFGCQIEYKYTDRVIIINKMHSYRGTINYFEKSAIAPVVSSSSIVVKRCCFKTIGLFNLDLARGEDLELWWRLACKYQMAFEPKPLVTYVQDSINRACKTVLPLNRYFLPKNISSMSKEKQKFALKLIQGVIFEMAFKRKYKALFKLLSLYRLYAINVFWLFFIRFIKKLTSSLS